MLSLSSSPPFVFYFLLVFLLFHVVFLLLVLIKVDSKTSPSCLSSFLSFCFVFFSVLCRKLKGIIQSPIPVESTSHLHI
ncbi:unnamed protein product [Prunus brigantina]